MFHFAPQVGQNETHALFNCKSKNRKAFKHAKLRKLTVCQDQFNIQFKQWLKFNFLFWYQNTKSPQLNRRQPGEMLMHMNNVYVTVFGQTHQSNAILSWDRNTDPSRPKIGPNSKIDSLFYNENWASGAKWNSFVLPHHKVFHFAPTTQHCGSRDYLGQGMHQGNHRVAGVSVKVQTTSKTSICKQDDILLTVIRCLWQY